MTIALCSRVVKLTESQGSKLAYIFVGEQRIDKFIPTSTKQSILSKSSPSPLSSSKSPLSSPSPYSTLSQNSARSSPVNPPSPSVLVRLSRDAALRDTRCVATQTTTNLTSSSTQADPPSSSSPSPSRPSASPSSLSRSLNIPSPETNNVHKSTKPTLNHNLPPFYSNPSSPISPFPPNLAPYPPAPASPSHAFPPRLSEGPDFYAADYFKLTPNQAAKLTIWINQLTCELALAQHAQRHCVTPLFFRTLSHHPTNSDNQSTNILSTFYYSCRLPAPPTIRDLVAEVGKRAKVGEKEIYAIVRDGDVLVHSDDDITPDVKLDVYIH